MAKKQKLFSLDDELCVKLQSINASALANRLLTLYFNPEIPENEEEILSKIGGFMKEKAVLTQKVRILKDKLGDLQDIKEVKKQKMMSEEEKVAREAEVAVLKRRWREGEITDEEYWSNF